MSLLHKVIIGCLLLSFPSQALAAEQFTRPESMNNEMTDFLEENDREMAEFRIEADKEFTKFIAEIDKEFVTFLKQSWDEFFFEKPLVVSKEPKPKKLPTYTPQPDIPALDQKPSKVITPPVPPAPRPLPKLAIRPKAKPVTPIVKSTPLTPERPTVAPVIPKPKLPPIAKKNQTPPPTIYKIPEPPKTVVIPKKAQKPISPKSQIATAPTPKPAPKPKPVVAKKPEGKNISFAFYGSKITLPAPASLDVGISQKINNITISAYWDKIARADFKPFLNRLTTYQERFQLNDWGMLLLLDQIAPYIISNSSPNNRQLFTWFMMTKLGYEVKVGYNNNLIVAVMPATSQIFGTTFLKINGKRYYAVTFDNKPLKMKNIKTYRKPYPGSEYPLDFAVRSYPSLANSWDKRPVSFKYKHNTYHLTLAYNKNSIQYFQNFPAHKFNLYAHSQIPSWTMNSLEKGLRPIIAGKDQAEAVNILLRFTQTAFKYQTDDQQFQREKYFFPEETVFYPYSDCEDRSILFSYLVRKLVGLDVVLLYYPGHMATAVRFTNTIKGDSVTVKGKRFLICDPTYINANIGRAMPKYREVTPEAIVL